LKENYEVIFLAEI